MRWLSHKSLSLALLISTGLFLRTLRYAQQIDLGFKPDQVLQVSFNLRLQGYNEAKGREFTGRLSSDLKACRVCKQRV
jgi:hypothetical protein